MTDNQPAVNAGNPIAHLYHDGSDAAAALLAELLRCDVPHKVSYDVSEYALNIGVAGMLTQDKFTLDAMLVAIRLKATRDKASLRTDS